MEDEEARLERRRGATLAAAEAAVERSSAGRGQGVFAASPTAAKKAEEVEEEARLERRRGALFALLHSEEAAKQAERFARPSRPGARHGSATVAEKAEEEEEARLERRRAAAAKEMADAAQVNLEP